MDFESKSLVQKPNIDWIFCNKHLGVFQFLINLKIEIYEYMKTFDFIDIRVQYYLQITCIKTNINKKQKHSIKQINMYRSICIYIYVCRYINMYIYIYM